MERQSTASALWITMVQAGLLASSPGSAAISCSPTVLQAPARAQGPGPERRVPGPAAVRSWRLSGGGERDRSSRSSTRTATSGSTAPSARPRANRSPPTLGRAASASAVAAAGGFGRGGLTPGRPGPKLTPADVKSYPAAPLYDLGTLRTIFLQFENADWEQELAAFHNTDVEVPATAIVDGKTYKDVGVHFRGMSSYMMVPEGSKRSLNLSFDFVDENQASAATAR